MKKTFRKLAFLFVILSLCFTLLGCQDEGKVKGSDPSLVENFVNETQKQLKKGWKTS